MVQQEKHLRKERITERGRITVRKERITEGGRITVREERITEGGRITVREETIKYIFSGGGNYTEGKAKNKSNVL